MHHHLYTELGFRPAPETMNDQRCQGAGELDANLTPDINPRDPRSHIETYACPGCPDCLMGVLLDEGQVLELYSRPEQLVYEITDDGLRLVGEGEKDLGLAMLSK